MLRHAKERGEYIPNKYTSIIGTRHIDHYIEYLAGMHDPVPHSTLYSLNLNLPEYNIDNAALDRLIATEY